MDVESEDEEIKETFEMEQESELHMLLSKEDMHKIRKKWEHTLIVKVFGKVMGFFFFLKIRLQALWKLK